MGNLSGAGAFAHGTGPNGARMVMLNVNCLEPAIPIDRNAITHWDGASM